MSKLVNHWYSLWMCFITISKHNHNYVLQINNDENLSYFQHNILSNTGNMRHKSNTSSHSKLTCPTLTLKTHTHTFTIPLSNKYASWPGPGPLRKLGIHVVNLWGEILFKLWPLGLEGWGEEAILHAEQVWMKVDVLSLEKNAW